MFRVDWLQSALDELATIWTGADSSLRTAITAATHAVEQRLRATAPNEGESRPGGRRIMLAPPLVVTFQVVPDGAAVTVLHVHVLRRRSK